MTRRKQLIEIIDQPIDTKPIKGIEDVVSDLSQEKEEEEKCLPENEYLLTEDKSDIYTDLKDPYYYWADKKSTFSGYTNVIKEITGKPYISFGEKIPKEILEKISEKQFDLLLNQGKIKFNE